MGDAYTIDANIDSFRTLNHRSDVTTRPPTEAAVRIRRIVVCGRRRTVLALFERPDPHLSPPSCCIQYADVNHYSRSKGLSSSKHSKHHISEEQYAHQKGQSPSVFSGLSTTATRLPI